MHFQGSWPATFPLTRFNLLPILADMRKPKLAAEIAKELRKFHEVEVPISKEPQLWIDMFNFYEKGFHLIEDWLPLLYVYTLVSYLYMIKWNWPDFQGLAGGLAVLISIQFGHMWVFSQLCCFTLFQPLFLNLTIVRRGGCMRRFHSRKYMAKLLSSR